MLLSLSFLVYIYIDITLDLTQLFHFTANAFLNAKFILVFS